MFIIELLARKNSQDECVIVAYTALPMIFNHRAIMNMCHCGEFQSGFAALAANNMAFMLNVYLEVWPKDFFHIILQTVNFFIF